MSSEAEEEVREVAKIRRSHQLLITNDPTEESLKNQIREYIISPGLELGMPRRVALITGITGQDGSYLADLLIQRGYFVHGIIRRSSTFNTGRIEHLYHDLHVDGLPMILHYGDLTDSTNLVDILNRTKPDEVYNLAAQSHVKVSFQLSEYTAQTSGVGTLRLLDAIRTCQLTNSVRFYQASTSEMFGGMAELPYNESTPFYPRSPYAAAKLYAHWITINYREAYGLHASNGILFNHESPRRGPNFVTRKITRAVARIKHNVQDSVYLGNLNASRDWGHAKEYVEAMWLMLQQPSPSDFVIATGEIHSVREFVEEAFSVVNIKILWTGEGVDEVGINSENGRVVVKVDPLYYRPTEVDKLKGDASKAKLVLGWEPKTTFKDLVREMVESDVQKVLKGDLIS